MSKRFEDLTRAMADPMPRRGALRLLGAAVAAAGAAVVVGTERGDARTTAKVCKPGQSVCGNKCCDAGAACSRPGCCCPSGTTPCGHVCCNTGVSCADRSRGLCGCPSGTTPCGTGRDLRCCPAGSGCQKGCPRPHSNVAKHC